MKPLLLVLTLTVSLGIAGDPTATGDIISSGSGPSWQGSEYEVILWSQLPTGSAMGSQYFPDMYPDYDSGVADDFEFAETTTIKMIRWWGGYWNGGGGPIDSPVEIYLYLDDGTGNGPTLPQHTSAIQSWMIPPGSYSEVADGVNYLCEFEFYGYVVLSAGVKYWFEIRKAFPFDPYGQYGWIQSEPVSLSPCVQGFDGLGIDWWTAQTTDAAFELVWWPNPALERSTWAEIKTIF
ncbi:hypothetical protein DRQ25_13610 [Candidatus Fermentibacteria bacterium]|nr:MAG: hypothetical protein DRQ25_13610 [Candidatus Fermentibacteria bacterium]